MSQIDHNDAIATTTSNAATLGTANITADLLDAIRKHTKQPGESWSAETTLEDIGVDSFDLVELIFEIEDKYGVDINFNANATTDDLATVGDVARLIAQALAKEAGTS
jgi:acyl carrier protein